jgi:hypothetical protein
LERVLLEQLESTNIEMNSAGNGIWASRVVEKHKGIVGRSKEILRFAKKRHVCASVQGWQSRKPASFPTAPCMEKKNDFLWFDL